MATPPESRFGLSFSSTTIIASRFNSTGSIELVSFPADLGYRALYAEAVQRFPSEDDIDEANIKTIFEDSVAPISKSLTKQIENTPEYATLFLPSVFDWRTRGAAGESVFKDAQYATRVAPSRQASCYGFGFLQCKNLGRPLSDCNDDDPESLVLLFEYEKEYLHVWLLWVSFELGVHAAQDQKMCKGCGEDYREAVGDQAYQNRLNIFVQSFLDEQVLPKHKREDIRAVVITGEASAAAVKNLGNTALEGVRTEEVKLMTEFAPSEIVARGAAVFARLTQDNPERFISPVGNIIPDDKEWAEMHVRIAQNDEEHSEL